MNKGYTIATAIGNRWAKWRKTRRTYAELNALSIDGLLDLDLSRDDLWRIAQEAAAGRRKTIHA